MHYQIVKPFTTKIPERAANWAALCSAVACTGGTATMEQLCTAIVFAAEQRKSSVNARGFVLRRVQRGHLAAC